MYKGAHPLVVNNVHTLHRTESAELVIQIALSSLNRETEHADYF